MNFKTNAKTVQELDLAMVEIAAVSGRRVEYRPEGWVYCDSVAVSRPVLDRCAFVDSDDDADQSTWSKMRAEIVEPLLDHSLHNLFPFEGKMRPQIARALINICAETRDDAVVADPFVGSGTTLLEAALLGYPSFGADVDPFSVYLTSTKLELEPPFLRRRLDELYEFGLIKTERFRDALIRSSQNGPGRTQAHVELETAEKFLAGMKASVIVTSPPYHNLIDYNDRHKELRAHLRLGEPLTPLGVGQLYDDYRASIDRLARLMSRALTIDGRAAIVVGEDGAGSPELWETAMKAAGMRMIHRMTMDYRAPTRGVTADTIIVMEK